MVVVVGGSIVVVDVVDVTIFLFRLPNNLKYCQNVILLYFVKMAAWVYFSFLPS